MIKLLLLLMFLTELGGDFNPLDSLLSFDKRAACQRVMTRFFKCSGPQAARIFTPSVRQQLIAQCAKHQKQRDFRKAARCLRQPTCAKFNACLTR